MTPDTAAVLADVRAHRRAFIRNHHPDRGGDPGSFITGLAVLDAQAAATVRQPEGRSIGVSFYRRRPLHLRLALAVRRWCNPPPARVQ